MHMQEALALAKRWIDPPNPGKNKSMATAALLGGLFGPIGVGVHLRSLAQFGWCLLGGMALSWLTGWRDEVSMVVAAVVWGPLRVWIDNRPALTPPLSSDGSVSPQCPPESTAVAA